MLKSLIILITLALSFMLHAQKPIVDKIEPPNWWVDHSYNNIELMVYGDNLDYVSVHVNSRNIIIDTITPSESNKYTFIKLKINEDAKPSDYLITLTNKNGYSIFDILVYICDLAATIGVMSKIIWKYYKSRT